LGGGDAATLLQRFDQIGHRLLMALTRRGDTADQAQDDQRAETLGKRNMALDSLDGGAAHRSIIAGERKTLLTPGLPCTDGGHLSHGGGPPSSSSGRRV
jgi:hypothetical protein